MTRLYMSVPGNRGTEDAVLYAALGVAAAIVASLGVWAIFVAVTAPDRNPVVPVLAVRKGTFLDAREQDGRVTVRVRGPQGVREVVLPSTDFRAQRALMLKPGSEVKVPASGKDAWEE